MALILVKVSPKFTMRRRMLGARGKKPSLAHDFHSNTFHYSQLEKNREYHPAAFRTQIVLYLKCSKKS